MNSNTMTTPDAADTTTSSALSLPRILLHLEGAAVLAAALVAYAQLDASWWAFAALLLIPDVTAAGYLIDTRTGSTGYNIGHTYTLPLALSAAALASGWEIGLALALIWAAHIGLDRALGYGLKYPAAFKDTHLGRV
jgi:hypothetical protein